jgi:hypothetical protein
MSVCLSVNIVNISLILFISYAVRVDSNESSRFVLSRTCFILLLKTLLIARLAHDFQRRETVKNTVMSPVGLGTMNDCAGENQQ